MFIKKSTRKFTFEVPFKRKSKQAYSIVIASVVANANCPSALYCHVMFTAVHCGLVRGDRKTKEIVCMRCYAVRA